jgi:hypothetical protein
MITTPTVSGKPGQAPTGLSCDLYPLIGSQHLDRSSGSRHLPLVALAVEAAWHDLSYSVATGRELSTGSLADSFVTCALGRCRVGIAFPWQTVTGSN